MTKPDKYTNLELELISLKVAIDSIDSMVNRQMLDFYGSETRFKDDPQQKLFYILLTDFLSKKTDGSLMPDKLSCLERLGAIIEHPSLATDSIQSLAEAHKVFTEWLQKEIEANVWASSLNVQLSLRLSRYDVIYFAANMSKHHFGHLTDVTTKLYKQLEDQQRPRHDIIPALENIYNELHDNILNYHGSTISEMLNNLRWGIHDYLASELNRSYRKIDDVFYEFDMPDGVKTDFARSCYWDLMNSVRSRPYVNRFTVNEVLKLRY